MTTPKTQEKLEQWIREHETQEAVWNWVNRFYVIAWGSNRVDTFEDPENIHHIPTYILLRFKYARVHFNAIYFSRYGLFLAPASFSTKELSVYTWTSLNQDENLIEYAGQIWKKDRLELYFSPDPQVVFAKQKYLFTVPMDEDSSASAPAPEPETDKSLVIDPTDVNGKIQNIFYSHNIAPFLNEPGMGQVANCRVTWSARSENVVSRVIANQHHENRVKKRGMGTQDLMANFLYVDEPQKFVRIETCRFIEAFEELTIHYDNVVPEQGIGRYELRNYLVGVPCDHTPSKVLAEQKKLIQNHAMLEEQERRIQRLYRDYTEREFQRIDRIKSDEKLQTKADLEYFRFDRQVVAEEQKLANGSVRTWTRTVIVWPQLEVIYGERGDLIGLKAAIDLKGRMRLPIFGFYMTSVEFAIKLIHVYEHARHLLPYMVCSNSGYCFADPSYFPYQKIGGEGAFIWTALGRTTGKKFNLKITRDGYFETLRTIKTGELLVFNPVEYLT